MEENTKDLSGLEEYFDLQLSGSDAVSFRSSIYKVPKRILKIREEAYTPRLVSIGPLHRRTISLQSGEQDKIKYANNYFSKFPSYERRNFLEEAYSWEKRARACYCYDDVIKLSSNEFVYMILVDGIFIVQFLLKSFYLGQREPDDQIFQKEWVWKEILRDMMLLENQLPFFVIEYLFNRLNEVCSLDKTLIDLIYAVFQSPLKLGYRELPHIPGLGEIYHLVSIFYLSIIVAPSLRVKTRKGGKLVDNSSATELQEAGVKFVGVMRECPYDINFDTKTGLLTIPCLVVNQWTDSLLGNLNAFEQCQFNGTFINSYIFFMGNLINTPADVELLVGSEIIETQASSEDVCTLFNNLNKRTALNDHKFLFSDLCEDLNGYSRDPWHKWKRRTFKHGYFSNPWAIISVNIGGFTLIILTAIQTICSIMALKSSGTDMK